MGTPAIGQVGSTAEDASAMEGCGLGKGRGRGENAIRHLDYRNHDNNK